MILLWELKKNYLQDCLEECKYKVEKKVSRFINSELESESEPDSELKPDTNNGKARIRFWFWISHVTLTSILTKHSADFEQVRNNSYVAAFGQVKKLFIY